MRVKRLIWSLLTRIGQRRNTYRIVVGTPQGKDNLEKLGVGGNIIVKCILAGNGPV
jgi:hypothetical protein